MADRIRTYLAWLDKELEKDENDWTFLLERHKQEILFFQHERLIHLIVMALTVIVAILFFIATMLQFSIGLCACFFAMLVLVIPYVKHYFLLENGVQKMYYQYDTLQQKINNERPLPKFIKKPKYVE